MPKAQRRLAVCAVAATLLQASAFGAGGDRFAGVEIRARHVAGSVYMLEGAGGNIAVSVGDDGTLMVDNQYAPLSERILAAIRDLGGDRPRLIVNTHVHGDHVGGNPFFGAYGTVLSHANVRIRLAANETPRAGLPIVTYRDRVTLHFNDDEIDVIHMPRGHTDGDSIVWFKTANVLHMGDHYFNGRFPFIDLDNGGSVAGFVENIDRAIALVAADTKIIPGHGPLSNVVGLAAAADLVRDAERTVRAAVAENRLEALLTNGFGGRTRGWDNHERLIRTIQTDQGGGGETRR